MPNIYNEIYSTIINFEKVTNENLEKYAFSSESDETSNLMERLNRFVNSQELQDLTDELRTKLPAEADVEDEEEKKIKNYYANQLRDLLSKNQMTKDDITLFRELFKDDDPNTEKVVENFITFIEPDAPGLEEEPKVAAEQPQIEPENINKPPENKIENKQEENKPENNNEQPENKIEDKPEIINEQQKNNNENPQEIKDEQPEIKDEQPEIKDEQPEIKDEEEEIVPPANTKFEASQIKLHLNQTMINKMESSLKQNPTADEAYKEFTNSLKTLKKKTDEYYTPDENGDFPKLTKDQLEELLNFYNNAATKADKVINVKSEDKNAKLLQKIAGTVKPLLDTDRAALETAAELNETMSLPELIYKGRSVVVHTANAAGMMNTRMIIKGGAVYDPETGKTNLRMGYFTKEKTLDLDNDFKELCDRLTDNYGDKYKNLIDIIRNSSEVEKKRFFADEDRIDNLNPNKNNPILNMSKNSTRFALTFSLTPRVFNGIFYQNNKKKIDTEVYTKKLYNEDNFFDFMDELWQGLYSIAANHYMRSEDSPSDYSLGLKKGSPSASRNVAMYQIAKLFGVEGVVAEAKSVTIMQDGKEIHGVLMQDVKGLDVTKVTEQEANYTAKTFDTPELKKQIADLQAIDWICGNLDRNTSNFILQLKDSGTNKAKAIRIVGIDNDNSFPPKDKLASDHLAEPDHMVVISKNFYKRMINITKEQFQTVLEGHELSKEEIDAAWNRRDTLLRSISEKRIKVVDDKDWGKHSLADLQKKQRASYQDPDDKPTGLFIDVGDTVTDLKGQYNYNQELKQKKERKEKSLTTLRNGKKRQAKKDEKIIGSFAGPAISYKKDPDTLRLMLPDLTDVKPLPGEISYKYPISFKENNEKVVEGFFTMQHVVSTNVVVGDVMDNAEEKYPHYKPVWKKLRMLMRTNTETAGTAKTASTPMKILDDFNSIHLPTLFKNDEKLAKDKVFRKAWEDVRADLTGRVRMLDYYYSIGAQPYERIELRNVTMSEVADAIDKPGLLVKSRKVQVLCNGEITEGIFTEKAKGEDIDHIEDGGGLRALTLDNSEEAFNTTEGLKSLADLQVIDYICNHTDRRSEKISFQFDTLDPNNPKLIGVQGIDNNMSFGIREEKTSRTDVTVMTVEMANKIKDGSLSNKIEEKLKKSTLSEQAKKAVLARIETLKQKLDKQEIKIVPDTKWGKDEYTLEKLKNRKDDLKNTKENLENTKENLENTKENLENTKENLEKPKKNIFDEADTARKKAIEANKKANKKLNGQAEQNAEQKPQTKFPRAARVESFGMNAAEQKEYKELCDKAERKFIENMDNVISSAPPLEKNAGESIDTHEKIISYLTKVCKDMNIALKTADPLFHFSSGKYKAVRDGMDELTDTVGKISERFNSMEATAEKKMEEDEIQILYTQIMELNRRTRAYKAIRDYAEGSALSKLKFKACERLEKDLNNGLTSLGKLFHKEHINDLDKAKDMLINSRTKTNELAQKENDRSYLQSYVALQIYYTAVQRSDVKNKNQLIQALSPEKKRDGIKLIMDDPAFKTISSKSDKELKALCANSDNLFEEFIRNKARSDDLKNENGAKQMNENIAKRHKAMSAK